MGLSKKEVLNVMGKEFNHYPLDVWTYYLKNTWLGKKVYLVICFNNNKVSEIKITKSWH